MNHTQKYIYLDWIFNTSYHPPTEYPSVELTDI
jgi:hypothetical protein